jgi:hypothetical protein
MIVTPVRFTSVRLAPGLLRWLLLLLLAGLGTACSGFDARWKAAGTAAGSERWDGRWTSGKHITASGSAAGGRLRAVIEPGPQQALNAHLRANWLLFTSDYSMVFTPKPGQSRRSPGREFSGVHQLPKLFGGAYRYDARLAGDRLTARYTSSYDHGTFVLRRVVPEKDYASPHPRD